MDDSQRVSLLDIRFDSVELSEATSRVTTFVQSRQAAHVVTPNVDILLKAQRDPALARAIRSAQLVVADGVPLLWMARLQGTPLRGRVNGTDLTNKLLGEEAPKREWRVAIVGGAPGVAQQAASEAARRWGTTVVFADGPTRAQMDDEGGAVVARSIRAAGADIAFFALDGGRQELWISRNLAELGCVAIGVGSAIDFLAGTARRAPVRLQRLGLEWAWRLALEPRRLWRRYLIEDPQLFAMFARERLTKRRR